MFNVSCISGLILDSCSHTVRFVCIDANHMGTAGVDRVQYSILYWDSHLSVNDVKKKLFNVILNACCKDGTDIRKAICTF